MKNKIKGKEGEKIAQDYLVQKGYEILDINFHFSRYGEIDIIAKKDGKMVFVEVKARSSLDFGHPFEAITSQKLRKIYSCALHYMQNKPYASMQIDAISILLNENPPKIEHLENIGNF